jgi:hypothetical protein
MVDLQPWERIPFELIVHAEGHLRKGGDVDKRMALIGFDSSIEVSIAVFIRNCYRVDNHRLRRTEQDEICSTYIKKLDFLGRVLSEQNANWLVSSERIQYFHTRRNDQYHEGMGGVPRSQDLQEIRRASLWVFQVLFQHGDVESLLHQAILEENPPDRDRIKKYDRAIDEYVPEIVIGKLELFPSDVLFACDFEAYKEIGAQYYNLHQQLRKAKN